MPDRVSQGLTDDQHVADAISSRFATNDALLEHAQQVVQFFLGSDTHVAALRLTTQDFWDLQKQHGCIEVLEIIH